MKKLLLVLAASACACWAQADTMSFITVLSSPVGSFNKLETVDPNTPAYGKTVNFCTKIGTRGAVKLEGVKTANLNQITLSEGSALGSEGGKYSLANIQLNDRGSIEGERLFAKQVEVRQPASGYSENLYGNTLTVAGAKTKDLTVYANDNNRKSSIVEKDGQDSPAMVWSNEYQSDSACGNTDTCAKQYLLKSGRGSAGCSDYNYRKLHKAECCPSSYQSDPACYKEKSFWRETFWYPKGYNSVAVSSALYCSDDSFSGGGSAVIYPLRWKDNALWELDGYAPSCFSQNIKAGDECSQEETRGNTCFIGLSGNWIEELHAYYRAEGSYPPPLDLKIDTTDSIFHNVGCVWMGIQKWPQLECAKEYVRDGW